MSFLFNEKEKEESWDSFYTSAAPVPLTFTDETTQQKPSGNSVFVCFSSFSNFEATKTGGCIFVSNNAADVLVEESSFTELSSTNFAVALFFKVKNVVYNITRLNQITAI